MGKFAPHVASKRKVLAKALKKSLIERIKDLPVVTQVSQLGAAGTVAVSTAAVTQVDIAQDRTEIFVAEVAQDVVEERFENNSETTKKNLEKYIDIQYKMPSTMYVRDTVNNKNNK